MTSTTRSSDVRAAVSAAVLSLVVGLVVGVVWRVVAPEPVYVVVQGGAQVTDATTGAFVAQDGWLAVLAALAGAASAAAAFLRWRRQPLGTLLGLALGGCLGAVVAWRLGVALAPDPHETLRSAKLGAHIAGGLVLRAKGVLLFWPIAAVVVHFALVGGLDRPAHLSRHDRSVPSERT